MAKYSYTIESFSVGKWRSILSDTRDFCLGYLSACKQDAPRNSYRLIRSDGKVLSEVPANLDVNIGMIAGWPTPEQYEAAAQRALAMAAHIREERAKHEAS